MFESVIYVGVIENGYELMRAMVARGVFVEAIEHGVSEEHALDLVRLMLESSKELAA